MQIKDFAKIYFVLLIAHLAVLDVGENQALINFTKPLLLISLIAFFIHRTNNRLAFEKKYLIGLVFSLIGDALLMFTAQGEIWFMLGLGAFLVAQIFFSIAFLTENSGTQKSFLKNQPWLILPLLAYGVWFVAFLKEDLGELLIPVTVYAFALVAMAASALNRKNLAENKSFLLVFVGALFFVFSDSVLAYLKFKGSINHGNVLVMASYGIAQFLMLWGMLFERLKSNTDQHQKPHAAL